jgi:hypothetical protein
VPAPVPPDVQQLAAAHRAAQQQLTAAAVAEAGRLWGFLQTLGWAGIAGRVATAVRSAMRGSARGAQRYTTAAAAGWGAEPDPAGEVVAEAFAVTASDGRPLETLLGLPAGEVDAFVAQGKPLKEVAEIGRRHLQRIVATQVADAGRVATGVAVVNDRKLVGYIRHLTLPSCNRCILLAGQWYRWNDGFERHPLCDCVHVPAAIAADPASPREIYDSLDDDERRKAGWSGFDQRAVDDGADLFQVTNYKRALKTVQVAGLPVKTTTVATSRRSLARKRLGKGARRLTPEQIYLNADRLGWDRDATIRELKRHGYIL